MIFTVRKKFRIVIESFLHRKTFDLQSLYAAVWLIHIFCLCWWCGWRLAEQQQIDAMLPDVKLELAVHARVDKMSLCNHPQWSAVRSG